MSENRSEGSAAICAVAVDLGTCNTGVVSYLYEPGQDPAEGDIFGTLIRVPAENPSRWDQAPRRQSRHQRRGHKRRKLARRLLHSVLQGGMGLPVDELSKRNREVLDGLLKRRGFTFISAAEDSDTTLEGEDPSQLAELTESFEAGMDLAQQVGEISTDPDRLARALDEPIFALNKTQLKKHLAGQIEDASLKKDMIEQISLVGHVLRDIDKALRTGHRHRREYFREIRADLIESGRGQRLCHALGVEAEALARVVGHVSNLQLRALRWYFNDPKMSGPGGQEWRSDRLDRCFRRWVRRWQPRQDREISQRRSRLLRHDGPTLDLWKTVDPEETVPPFENQNNRRPPECQSLLMDTDRLDSLWPRWRRGVANLRRHHEADFGESLGNDAVGDAAFLHRFLDLSRAADPYRLRLLAHQSANDERPGREAEESRCRLSGVVGSQHLDALIDLAVRYYAEAGAARRGVWSIESTSGLLSVCRRHPPLKKRQRHLLLDAMLGTRGASPESVEALVDWIGQEKLKGNRGIKGVLKECAETQKDYGNGLKFAFRQAAYQAERGSADKKEKALLKLVGETEQAADRLGEHLDLSQEQIGRFRNVFSMGQLWNLLYADVHGFGRTCRRCAVENVWRSRVEDDHARALRLPADSIRPFDGHVRGAVQASAERAARWLAGHVAEHLEVGRRVHLPLVIEQNAFRFAADKAELKRRTVDRRRAMERIERQETTFLEGIDRLRAASQGVCPYTGNRLGAGGEIDHILPRSETRDTRGTILNSEANLIYASSEGNRRKGDRRYTLEDLSDCYLEAVFGRSDRSAVAGEIRERVDRLLASGRFTSFRELSDDNQKALRHALFLPDTTPRVLPLLSGRVSARVNGTQAYWARHFVGVLRDRLARKGMDPGAVTVLRIPSGDAISVQREMLAQSHPTLAKRESQSAGSHLVDAAMAMAAMLGQVEAGYNPLRTLVSAAHLEDPEWLRSLLPDNFRIENIDSRPVYAVRRPWTRQLFKSSIYGERFLPLWCLPDGSVGAGFNEDAVATFRFTGKQKQTGTDALLDLLGPYLAGTGQSTASDAGATTHPIDRQAAFELFRRVTHASDVSSNEIAAARVLDALRYTTVRKPAINVLLPGGNQPADTNKLRAMTNQRVKPTLKSVPIAPDLKVSLSDESLLAPLSRDWQKLLDHPDVVAAVGDRGALQKLDFGAVWSERFVLSSGQRKHQRVRQTFSLPVIEAPSGGYRLARRKNGGDTVWQLVAVESAAYEGFRVDEETGEVDFNTPVPFHALRSSVNLVPRDLSAAIERGTGPVCRFDHWLELEGFDWPEGTVRVAACPNEKSRFRLEIDLDTGTFLELVQAADGANDEEVGCHTTLPAFEVPHSTKPPSVQAWKERFDWIPAPRSSNRLAVSQVGPDRVRFRYTVGSTPKWLKDAYSRNFSRQYRATRSR